MATITLYANAGDCWKDKDGNFSSTGSNLYMVDSPFSNNGNVRTWIPFTVPLRGNTVINQAFLVVTANATSSNTEGNIQIACEAADNPSTPVSAADLGARALSAYKNTFYIYRYDTGTDYIYQIDNPVSETLLRPGWRSGNTLAIIIDDVNFGDGTERSIYSREGSATLCARLIINYQADDDIGIICVV